MSQAQKENVPKKVLAGNRESASTKRVLVQRKASVVAKSSMEKTCRPLEITKQTPNKAAPVSVLTGSHQPTAASRLQMQRSASAVALPGQPKAAETSKSVLLEKKGNFFGTPKPTPGKIAAKSVLVGRREPTLSSRFQARRSVSAMVLPAQRKDAETPKSIALPKKAPSKSSREMPATSRFQARRSVSALALTGQVKDAEKPKSLAMEKQGNPCGTLKQTPKKPAHKIVLREAVATGRLESQRNATVVLLSAQRKNAETPKSVPMEKKCSFFETPKQTPKNTAPSSVLADSRTPTATSRCLAHNPVQSKDSGAPKSVALQKNYRTFKNAEIPKRMKRRSKDMRYKKPSFKPRYARPITLSEALHVKDYIPRSLLQYPSSTPTTGSSIRPNKAPSLDVTKYQTPSSFSPRKMKTAVFMKNHLVRISSLGSDVAVSSSHADLSGTLVLPGHNPLLTQFLGDTERYGYERQVALAGQRIATLIMVNSWRQRGAEVKRLREKNDQLNNVRKITRTDLQLLRSRFHVEQNRAEDLQRLLDSEKMVRENLTASLTAFKVEKAVLEQQLKMREEMIATLNEREAQLKLNLCSAREQETKLRIELTTKEFDFNVLNEEKHKSYAAEIEDLNRELNLLKNLMQVKNDALKKAREEMSVLRKTIIEQALREEQHKQHEVELNLIIAKQRVELETMRQNYAVENSTSESEHWMLCKGSAMRFVQLAILFLMPQRINIPFEQILCRLTEVLTKP